VNKQEEDVKSKNDDASEALRLMRDGVTTMRLFVANLDLKGF